MIIGLGTLTRLRAALLPASFAKPGEEDTQFDALLTTIGKGVAAQFEAVTNRRLLRLEDARETFRAGRSYLSLSRYPVENVTALEYGYGIGEAWTAFDPDLAVGSDLEAGLVCLGEIGSAWTLSGYRFRVTFTGGYWIPDDDEPEGPPTDAVVPLPDDLALAWTLQCVHVFEAMNAFSSAALTSKVGDVANNVGAIALLPVVAATLRSHTRLVS